MRGREFQRQDKMVALLLYGFNCGLDRHLRQRVAGKPQLFSALFQLLLHVWQQPD